MKIDMKTVGLTALCLAVAAGGLWFQLTHADRSKAKTVAEVTKPTARQIIEAKAAEARARRRAKLQGKTPSAAVQREKPRVMLDDEEERKLNSFSRMILRELQEALDGERLEAVRMLVAKIQETPPDPAFGSAGVAELIRRKSIEAMGWFGAAALPELVGALTDPNPEIAQASFDQFQLALEDISLSDYERAEIILMASTALMDKDNLEMLFMEINNMRHSVGAELIAGICENGTDPAKDLIPDTLEFFTGEDDIVTVEDLDRWLQENPDGPDDDDLYGGDKD